MKLSAILIATLATIASAMPSAEPLAAADMAPVELAERATPKKLIDLWDGSDFLGLKFTGSGSVGKCYNLKNKNKASSAKARPGYRCTVWLKTSCNGTGFSFNSKGSKKFPSWINNKTKSWKCVKA